MTVSLKHQFVSNVADSPDATLVQPSNWNAEHLLTANADSLLGAVTTGNVVEITCTSAGRALLDDADASAQRTTLGLGSIATQNANNVSITGGSVSGITDLAIADGGTGASDAGTARTNLGLGTISTQNSNNVSITGGSITGITDLAVADGGTGASDASTARTNLGIGTLGTQNANAVAITGGTIVANASGISIRDADASNVMTIAVGSNLTANTTLTLTTGATTNRTLDISATNVTVSVAGAALIDDADASAQRTTLGLGTISTQNSNNISITGGSITGITDLAVADGGTGASDASTARTNLGIGTIGTQNANNVSITGGSITGITDLAVADGGTGASDASTARTNLGIGTIGTQNANNVSITGGSITGITDLSVADGGTGASDASTARTNLGIGTMGTQNANAVAITGGTIVANASGISIRDADASNVMTIAVGSNLTANTTLTLTTGATTNRTLDISASNVTISTAGAALIDDADAAAQRTTLGLGTISTQNSNNVSITGGSITGITDLAVADGGTGASDASTARTNLGIGTIGTQNSNNVSITGGSITGITDLAVADGGTGASDASTARTNLGIGTIGTQNANNVSITGGSITGITDLAIADGGTGSSTAAGAATNLGLGTTDSPQFAAVNIGNATDTTITRVSAGLIAVEGKTVVTETGAQTVQFAAGTNTAPSITTTGNTNTGIFFPAANTIAFTEGGTEAMRIDSSGRVGIGTNAPLYNLDVQSSGEPIIRAKTSGTGSAWFVGEAGASGSVLWHNASNTASVFTTNGTERFRIGASGQWGIGGANYGTSGQVFTSGGSGAAPSWANGGGMTLLGTITTTSGSSQSLSGLTLTGYKFLVLSWNAVSQTLSSNTEYRFNDGTTNYAVFTSNNNNVIGNFTVWINLINGSYVTGGYSVTSSGAYEGTAGTPQMGRTRFSTSSTSVTVNVSAGAFDAGSVGVYGVS